MDISLGMIYTIGIGMEQSPRIGIGLEYSPNRYQLIVLVYQYRSNSHSPSMLNNFEVVFLSSEMCKKLLQNILNMFELITMSALSNTLGLRK